MILRLVVLTAALAIPGCGLWVNARADRAEAETAKLWPPLGAFIEVDGTPVHYLQKGTGPDLVLIHGAGGNLRDFSFSMMDRLASDYRVTAFDRPGLGYTGRLDKNLTGAFNASAESPQLQASLLARAATQIGVENPVVLGHSFGGSVAMAWGLDHQAAGLVIVAGAVMPWPGSLGAQYQILGSGVGGALVPPFVTAFKDPLATQEVVASIFAPQAAPEGYLPYVGPGLSLRRDTIRANARQVNTLLPHVTEMAQRYPEITIPVEFIHGDADTIVPLQTHAARAVPIMPTAALTVLDGIGHMPQHSREGAVIEAIHRAAERSGLR